MGYESTLIIGSRSRFGDDDAPYLLNDLEIRLDLSKAGGSTTATGRLLDSIRTSSNSEAVSLASHCDSCDGPYLTEDLYGDRITVVDRDALIAALESDVAGAEHPYRRFTLALVILRQLRDDPAWNLEADLVCTQFGH